MAARVITKKVASLEEIWPEVSRRAVTALRRRGVAPAAAEDAVQEAVARAIDRGIRFSDVEDLLPWIHTVAWRVVLDSRRRDDRLVYAVPDCESPENPARVVEARLQLQRLGELIADLSPADHDVLASRSDATLTRRESVRRAVRRHRVRAQLLALLDGVAVVLAWLHAHATPRNSRRAGVVALAPAVIVMSAMTLAPHWNDAPAGDPVTRSVTDVTTAVRAEATVAPAVAVPLRPVVSGTTSAGRPQPQDLPAVEVHHPGPGGGGTAWARPKEPDDHFVCLDVNAVGGRCVDLPVHITD
jgi:DNA-directed RNA polymerase specialized sigma24 family protein